MQEITTRVLARDALLHGWGQAAAQLQALGWQEGLLRFGSGWAASFGGPAPDPFRVSLGELSRALLAQERAGRGEVGCDDVELVLGEGAVCLRLCNDAHIHLQVASSAALADTFFTLWQAAGWRPVEYRIEQQGRKAIRTRSAR